MPGTWQGRERLQCTKYQMVVIIMLLHNGHWFWIISPSLVAICQYLSFTVPGLVASILSPLKGEIRLASSPHERDDL
jgi:hypothetical protein